MNPEKKLNKQNTANLVNLELELLLMKAKSMNPFQRYISN